MPTLDEVRARCSRPRKIHSKLNVLGGLWKRQELCARDRSIVTVAALIARNQTVDLSFVSRPGARQRRHRRRDFRNHHASCVLCRLVECDVGGRSCEAGVRRAQHHDRSTCRRLPERCFRSTRRPSRSVLRGSQQQSGDAVTGPPATIPPTLLCSAIFG